MNWGGLAREIVAKRVAILAAIPTLYAVLIGAGVKFPWTSEQVVAYVGAAITALSVAVGIFWARSGVTPADPALAAKPYDTGAGQGQV